MKKLLTIIGLLAIGLFVQAQNYAELHIEDVPAGQGNEYHYCATEYDGIEIYAQEGCPNFQWTVNYSTHYTNVDPLVLDNTEEYYFIHYSGCSNGRDFTIYFHGLDVQNPFAEPLVWKRQGESITLSVDYYDYYEVLWSNGSTDYEINVTEPGIYSVSFTSIYGCGTQTFYIEVRDNVEITLATCDLSSNLNVVTWQSTPAQAAYISQVIIKRDGMQVGTAPYEDGQFIDNIGSDAASRTYTIIGVMPNGEQCPIESYPKETIHMSYLLGVGGTIDLTWNTPTGYDLMGYNICEWNPNGKDGELTVIDYVGASVTSYTCFESQFNNGNIVVQGVEEGKSESRLLSNRSWETVGIDEIEISRFAIYPNPSNGMITIRGTGILTISNMIGQTIFQQEIDGESFVELPAGVYVAKLGNSVQKVVVE